MTLSKIENIINAKLQREILKIKDILILPLLPPAIKGLPQLLPLPARSGGSDEDGHQTGCCLCVKEAWTHSPPLPQLIHTLSTPSLFPVGADMQAPGGGAHRYPVNPVTPQVSSTENTAHLWVSFPDLPVMTTQEIPSLLDTLLRKTRPQTQNEK